MLNGWSSVLPGSRASEGHTHTAEAAQSSLSSWATVSTYLSQVRHALSSESMTSMAFTHHLQHFAVYPRETLSAYQGVIGGYHCSIARMT